MYRFGKSGYHKKQKINLLKNIWDKKIEVESNSYNWLGAPKLFEANHHIVNSSKPVHIDLFSGCGGFSCGFGQAGFFTTLAIDIHPPSLQTLLNNHQSTSGILGDISIINRDLLGDFSPKNNISVITAGVPCQGFSLSNRKRHADDKRNFLFQEFIKISKIF